jgi:uncharacterized protein
MKILPKLLLLIPLFAISCETAEHRKDASDYAIQIAQWDSIRLQRLKSPDGWVNLAGLFWLQEGVNTVGSAAGNDIVWPRGPEQAGSLRLEDGQVRFRPAAGIEIKAGGEPLQGEITIFEKDGKSLLLTSDSLGFSIILRGERFGIRLRDYLHQNLERLKHIDRYPASPNWIIKARFIESDKEITVRVPDVLGDITEEKVPGILEFEHGGKIRRLYPTGSSERLFIIFADDTNALETYGGGRFLGADGPDSDGYVYLDFNKSYNPPCAFSPFATCPLPPKENFLDFKITAGEKVVIFQ